MFRFLLVDDDTMVRNLMADYIRETLKDSGADYVVETACDGQDAIAKLTERAQAANGQLPYDGIFLDVRMPRLSGVEVHQWIVAHQPALKDRVCFVTGYLGDLSPAVRRRKVDLLTKPFLLVDVQRQIEKWIRIP